MCQKRLQALGQAPAEQPTPRDPEDVPRLATYLRREDRPSSLELSQGTSPTVMICHAVMAEPGLQEDDPWLPGANAGSAIQEQNHILSNFYVANFLHIELRQTKRGTRTPPQNRDPYG